MADDPTTRVIANARTIYAVHVAYASRGDELGKHPASPSYFVKPVGTLAVSGAQVVRPRGTELLGFEGEIALVIGTRAHQVSLADAWGHVRWVTAANDLGLHDLRVADAGSNVRSKGRDGYTPFGPALLDAQEIGPGGIRVRTWRNGILVQEDTTNGMLFPLAQVVADLSQHLTLEEGDIILTGTPAGASVVVPGDTVEVEVDAPSAPGAPTTGRLVSTVVAGTTDFDPTLGTMPSLDDALRAKVWGSREAAGLADTPVLDPALKAKLLESPTAGLSAQLRRRGFDDVSIDGVRPLHPGEKMVGVARTLRFIPARPDLFASHGGGYNAQKRLFDAVGPDEIIVIEARGESGSGTLGDVLAIRAHTAGAAGIVTDGGVRDIVAVTAVGLPIYTRGAHPAVLGRKHVPWDTDVTIACGGCAVQPGDILVGDADGVVVIPPSIAHEIVDAALAQEAEDAWIAERVAEGGRVEELFPMNAAWRSRFEAERA